MNMIMKKQYISPEISIEEMELEGMIAVSLGGVESPDTEHPIDVGGNAEEGGSDGRLGGWFDED